MLATLNDGAAIAIIPSPFDHSDGSTWVPITYPEDGYVIGGSDGVVTNIVYCTRFYDE